MQQLSVTEVSQMLKKSRQWVWFLIKTGRLKAKKVGNQYIVLADDLRKITNSSINNLKGSNHE